MLKHIRNDPKLDEGKNPSLCLFWLFTCSNIRFDISKQIGWQNKCRRSIRFNSCLSSIPGQPFICSGAHEIVSGSRSRWISAVRGQLSSETSLTGPEGFCSHVQGKTFLCCLYSLNAMYSTRSEERMEGTGKHSWPAKAEQSMCIVM